MGLLCVLFLFIVIDFLSTKKKQQKKTSTEDKRFPQFVTEFQSIIFTKHKVAKIMAVVDLGLCQASELSALYRK